MERGDAAHRDHDSGDAGQVELHLTLRRADAEAGARRLREARDELAAALGADVFSTDGRAMEEVVGALLRERRLTIAAGGVVYRRAADCRD